MSPEEELVMEWQVGIFVLYGILWFAGACFYAWYFDRRDRKEQNMIDIETQKHLLEWCDNPNMMTFSWPTDTCGYDQHVKFVRYRNDNWAEYLSIRQSLDPSTLPQKEFINFVRDYANNLVKKEGK